MGKEWGHGDHLLCLHRLGGMPARPQAGGHVGRVLRDAHLSSDGVRDRWLLDSKSATLLRRLYGSGFPKSHDVMKVIDAKVKLGSARTEVYPQLAMGDDYEPSGRGVSIMTTAAVQR